MPFVIGLGIGFCIVVAITAFVCAATNFPLQKFWRTMSGGEWY